MSGAPTADFVGKAILTCADYLEASAPLYAASWMTVEEAFADAAKHLRLMAMPSGNPAAPEPDPAELSRVLTIDGAL